MTTGRTTTPVRRIGVLAGSGAMLATGSGALLAATAMPAGAAPQTFTVSDLGDSGTNTLRWAIDQANGNAGKDTISFQSGLSGTISLSTALPAITEELDILGNDTVTIDGGWREGGSAGVKVFYLTDVSGSVTISHLTITGADSASGGRLYGSAIAVYNESGCPAALDLTIDSMNVTANYAGYSTLGFYFCTASTVTISNSTVSGNVSANGGGAVYLYGAGTNLHITNSTFDDNRNIYGEGGALYLNISGGMATIENSRFTNNTSYDEGGAIHVSDGDLTISTTLFENNEVTRVGEACGGALYLDTGNAVITDSVFKNNTATLNGGAIWSAAESLSISGTQITGNTATTGNGGGIAIAERTATTLTIATSTIADNTAGGSGGGIDDQSASITMRNTTISGNTAATDGGGVALRSVYIVIDPSGSPHFELTTPTLTAQNSTIGGNAATGGNGGAISGAGQGTTLVASTVTNNTSAGVAGVAFGPDPSPRAPVSLPSARTGSDAPARKSVKAAAKPAKAARLSAKSQGHGAAATVSGGAVFTPADGALSLTSTILAGNGTTDIGAASGAATSAVMSDHSIIGTSTVTITDAGGTQQGVTGAQLLLGPLADNGGATKTYALLTGSPAIDAGPASLTPFTGSTFDQRGTGFDRVINGMIDVGAFEAEPAPAPVVPTFTG